METLPLTPLKSTHSAGIICSLRLSVGSERRSWVLLRCDIDGAEIEQVGVGVKALDFEHFGNEPAPRAPFNLHDHVQGISDVGLNSSIRKFDAALQDTAGEAGEPLFRGTRMNRGDGSGMPGVQKLQKVESLAGTDFSQENTVRPVAERGFEQVPYRYGGRAILFAPRFEPNEIFMCKLNLGGVLDQQDAFVRWNEFPQGHK